MVVFVEVAEDAVDVTRVEIVNVRDVLLLVPVPPPVYPLLSGGEYPGPRKVPGSMRTGCGA